MRPITATVTPSKTQALCRLDNYATAVLGVQVVPLGGANFSLFHSDDDPCDLVNPVPLGSMSWQASLFPPAIGAAGVSFTVMASPLWVQLNLTNGVGSVRATFLQIGTHSHSNISKGPFAPPRMAEMTSSGSNYAAMPK